MALRPRRIPDPPRDVSASVAVWMREVRDNANQFPLSIFSTSGGPNASALTAPEGFFGLDVGSSSTVFWAKRSGSSSTGWTPLATNPTYGSFIIDQESSDDVAFGLRSSDITHGFTTFGTTDEFFNIRKYEGSTGGAAVRGIAENDAAAGTSLELAGLGGQPATTKTTTTKGLIDLVVMQHDGANGLANIDADGVIVTMRARVGGTNLTRWILDEDGDVWQTGSITHLGRHVSTFQTFSADDATPSVALGKNFKTANSNPTTITDFDDGVDGQEILVKINDANTTIDFTGSGLEGNAGVNWSPTSGDFMRCTYDGTQWSCSVHDTTA